jgi:hypothetical protein
VIDREPHTLTDVQKQALQLLSRMVIANFELRRDLQELKDALTARDAAEGPSGQAAVGLDEIIAKLRTTISELQAVREGKATAK